MKRLFIDTGAWLALNNKRDKYHLEAVKANFEKYSDKDFSFTDCTSFAVMAMLAINETFSFDKHF